MNILSKKILVPSLLLLVLLSIYIVIDSRNFKPIDPLRDTTSERDASEGKTNCIIYGAGKILSLGTNEFVEEDLKSDLLKYARTFLYDKIDNSKLCAFTFTSKYKDLGNSTYELSGKYFGSSKLIGVKATKLKNNYIKVSFFDKEGNNIDGKMRLNGPFVEFVNTLPIDEDLYSIRFSQNDGRVIVGFYIGYTKESVDTASEIIEKALGNDSEDLKRVSYFINGLGQYSINEIKTNMPKFVR